MLTRSGQYTMTIQDIMQNEVIFNFDYTLENVGVTNVKLQERFVDMYLLREIGFETYEIWHRHFKYEWKYLCLKYSTLFKKQYTETIEYLTSKGVTNASTYLTSSTGTQKTDAITVPISGEDNDPNSKLEVASEADGESTGSKETKIRSETEMEMINKYIIHYKDMVDMFLKELNPLFIGLY